MTIEIGEVMRRPSLVTQVVEEVVEVKISSNRLWAAVKLWGVKNVFTLIFLSIMFFITWTIEIAKIIWG